MYFELTAYKYHLTREGLEMVHCASLDRLTETMREAVSHMDIACAHNDTCNGITFALRMREDGA